MEAGRKEEREKKEQMAQIAHDLKTPLTIIRGNADLLLEEVEEKEGKEALEEAKALRTIIANCERIAQAIVEIISK